MAGIWVWGMTRGKSNVMVRSTGEFRVQAWSSLPKFLQISLDSPKISQSYDLPMVCPWWDKLNAVVVHIKFYSIA